MAIGLDSTAHPAGAGNLSKSFPSSGGATWNTLTTPTFSTGAGPILLAVKLCGDGGGTIFTGNTVTNTSGLTWTKRVDFNDSGGAGAQIWTAFSATGSLTSQTVTFTVSGAANHFSGMIDVVVLNGVAATEAACIGNTGGFIDTVGSSGTINATVTPAATGSVIVGCFGNDNGVGVNLAADSNTSPFDYIFQNAVITASSTGTVLTVTAVASGVIRINDTVGGGGMAAGTQIVSFGTGTGGTGTYNTSFSQSVGSATMVSGMSNNGTTGNGDAFASGMYKTGGTIATTTSGSNVTFGSSTSDLFRFSAALEIKLPSGVSFEPDEDYSNPYVIHPDQSIISVW